MLIPILSAALVVALGAALVFATKWKKLASSQSEFEANLVALSQLKAQHETLKAANLKVMERFGSIVDVQAEKEKLEAEHVRLRNAIQFAVNRAQATSKQLADDFESQKVKNEDELRVQRGKIESELNSLKAKINIFKIELAAVEEHANMAEFGFYQTRYDFVTSGAYAAKLDEIRESQKRMIKERTAATGSIEWTVNGSKTEGKKQINQTLKLLLRAFNGECDGAVARVKYNNISTMETRIQKAYSAINGLADVQQCRISPTYLDLKMQELHLAHEFQEKVQAEKEEQRRIREQMREEEVALRELEKAKADAERDENVAAKALEKARAEIAQAVGQNQAKLLFQINLLEQRLEEARANKERAISRAQLTRSGHVYVISNVGSFGENVFKIGMTRRLEPMDRVHELGDASVPFRFDVHAIIYSEDAPTLETTLHRAFKHRRVNAVNERREFFRVTLAEIATVVKQQHGEIEFVEVAEAIEYRKSLALHAAAQSLSTQVAA